MKKIARKKKWWKVFGALGVASFVSGHFTMEVDPIIGVSMFGLGVLSTGIFFFMQQGSDEAF